ncbi:Protein BRASSINOSTEROID INSENSITIVE 1 [Forsythia ovata]|uniref:non-specific serine/threonine protein kinase n=1 Tax=Forsythia ovata TaxID=205694 RepID=A0ABD1VL24_9LAMI
MTGSIPSSIGNCTNLNWISLSNKQLGGEKRASLGRLASLAILKLGNNSFFGNVPWELGDYCSLLWLDLNTNLLNVTIPPALFKQSGNIWTTFLAVKIYGYIGNDGSMQCHGASDLLEFGGIRQE